MSKLSSLIIL
jgi:hypothetical protein